MKKSSYIQFVIMLIISFVIMYAVMFFNVDKPEHIFLSLTRTYMSLLMVTPMAFLMLLMMRHMYTNKKLNILVFVLSGAVFVFSFISLRQQAYISDEQYMKGMISHHSSAIMTSRHADLKDPEVQRLSESIIKSQEEEIAQMKMILKRIE